MYLRKDAASSSQIEGTQATMMDAIEAEAHVSASLPKDVDDILHYINALNYGMKRVKEENFPVSLRFVRELHNVLMDKARATHFCDPGEFCKSQNWIGGTRPDNARFVPPPVEEMHRALNDLEQFMHSEDSTLTLYLKVDDSNRADYEAVGAEAFFYIAKGKKRVAMPYWQVPGDIMDDQDMLQGWAEKAYRAALASKTKKKPKPARKTNALFY